MSCPGTPSAQHGKLAAGGPSPVATLKRPTALSRHASAAGEKCADIRPQEAKRKD